MRRRITMAFGFMFMIFMGTFTAVAQDVTPNFAATVPTSAWTVDRAPACGFSMNPGTVNGRTNVLQISVCGAEYRGPGSFYNTEGEQYKYPTTILGSYSVQADLFVKSSWATNANGNVRTDLWGVAVDNTGSPWDYPIIGFSNEGGVGVLQDWNVNTGVWNTVATANYGAWNTVGFSWDASSKVYSYYVNNNLVETIQGDGVAVGLGAIIMQDHNSGDAFTADWSNTQAVTATPEPASLVLLGTGLLGVAGVVRRRKHSA